MSNKVKLEQVAAAANIEIITNTKPTRVARRHFKAMGFWLWSPAIAHPFRTLMWALEDLAMERKVDLGAASQVTMVRLSRLKGDSRIYLYPTDWNDPEGIEVIRNKTGETMNFYAFMAEAGLLVEVGYAERFSCEVAGSDSPVGPALVFDGAHSIERKVVRKSTRAKKNIKNEHPIN